MEGRLGKESLPKRLELDSEQRDAVREILSKDIYLKSGKAGECSINVDEACCIYRVPSRIRNVKPEVYTPQMVAIGPFQRFRWSSSGVILWDLKHEHREMEDIKQMYLKSFTERVGEDTIELMRKITEVQEEKIWYSYNDTTGLIESRVFVHDMLLDSLFIVEFIIRQYEVEEGIIEKSWEQFPFNIEMVKNDLIMLENQLPFFLLDTFIRPIINGVLLRTSSVEKTILRFFGIFFRDYDISFKHFTDMFRTFYEHSLDSNIKEDMMKYPLGWPAIKEMRRAEKLSQAGVNFKPSDNLDFSRNKNNLDVPGGHYNEFSRQMSRPGNRRVKKSLLNLITRHGYRNKERAVGLSLHVEFKKGTLSMPEFLANKESDMILRNVIAYEQCHTTVIPFTSNYINFLNFLITSAGDVDLLIEEGVVKNSMGRPIFVVNMVNELQFGLKEGNTSQYHFIAKKLKEHCNSRIKRYWAILNRVYFSDLWTGTATVVAVLLLVMTLVSTMATVIQTYVSLKQLQKP